MINIAREFEEPVHVTKTNAAIAVTSGTLLGLGVVNPAFAGLGIAVGLVGSLREKGRETDWEMHQAVKYIEANLGAAMNNAQNSKHKKS